MKALPTAQEIQNFLEIYRVRSLTKAAIRLGVTQPSVTQSLQKLEKKIGTPLFHRTKQGLVTTEGGNQFFVRACKLLEEWESFHAVLSSTKTELQGRFRVGCHSSVGGYVLPPLFAAIEKSAPKLDIELKHDLSRKILENIVSYDLELGFVVNPVRHPDLVLRKLGEDQVGFWKKKGSREVPKVLFMNQNLNQAQALIKKIGTQKFGDWKYVQSDSLEVIRTLVSRGLGVGILPKRIAFAESDLLTPYHSSFPTFTDEIYLVYRKEVLKTQAGQALLQAADLKL